MSTQFKISESGLYEEEVFMLLGEYELTRAQRYPSPVSLLHISLNLDQAKPSIVGTLKQFIASTLNTCLRVSDIPAHYGSDFLVLMPSTDETGAQAVSKRLISRLSGTRNFADGSLFEFVVHIGIATYLGGQSVSIETLVQQAKAALEGARKEGQPFYKQFE